MDLFLKKTWEGNVREMENVIMQGILFSSGEEIKPRDISLNENQKPARRQEPVDNNLPYKVAKEKTLKRFNHSFIGQLLESYSGNVSQAARHCGLERQALQQIMRRYDISADDYRNN